MKIKEVNLYGFKSFPSETKIVLDAGITAFVGPNGSGKSNIFDALRWVFGEQSMKALRCERIEDLIYVSPDSQNDANFTEVCLTIDNEDYFPQFGGEFEIKRRFYRSGESEFFLNRVKCRLQDIQALFLNSGTLTYSFLELSEIEKIIHGDTKHMFDDVSGILKYQERREQTRRRLESTEQDLLRLEDIIHEMQRSVRSLRRQVRQTRLYQELKQEFRTLTLYRLKTDFNAAFEKINLLQQDINGSEDKKQTFARDIKRLQEEREQLKVKMTAVESGKKETLSKITVVDDEIKALQARIESKEEETRQILLSNERTITSIREKEDIAANNKIRLGDYEEKRNSASQQLTDIKHDAEEVQAMLNTKQNEYFAHKQILAEKDTEIAALMERLQHDEQEIARLHLEKQNKEQLLARVDGECTAQREEIDRKRRAHIQMEKDMEGLIAQQEGLAGQLDGFTRKSAEAEQEYGNIEHDLRDRQDALVGCRLMIDTLARRLEEKEQSKFVQERFKNRYHGLFRELIEVQQGYESAVDICCSDVLDFYLVDNIRADDFEDLPEGRFGFISIKSEVDNEFPQAPPSSVPSIERFITFKSSGKMIIRYLRYYYVAKNFEEAKDLSAKFPGRGFVTQEGVLCKDGVAVVERGELGYFRATQSLQEYRSKAETLKNEILFLEEERKRIRETMRDIKENIESKKDELFSLNVKKSECSLKLNELSQGIEKLNQDAISLGKDRGSLIEEIARLSRVGDELRDANSRAKQDIEQLQNTKVGVTEQCQAREGELDDIRNLLSEKKMAMVAYEERLNSIDAAVQQLAGETEKIEREISTLKETQSAQRYEEVQRQINVLKDECNAKKEIRRQTEMLLPDKATEEIAQKLNNIYDQLDAVQKNHEDLQNAIMQLKYESFQLTVKKDELCNKAREEFGVNLQDHVLEEKIADVEARLAEVRGKLERLGEVNPLSLELYENEKKRLDDFLNQRDDIITARRTLLNSIEELDLRARERFTNVFEQVKKEFDFVFSNFFEGGHADLVLSDPGNPLVSKVDIVVRMKGKRLKIINQLSGGERTLLAISLLLAFYLVKPAPFCILDEIDAPLDDANVVRFNKFLRDLSQRTQVIIITHNRATMEYTDYLYGLTMERPGQSKIISARLADLERIGAFE